MTAVIAFERPGLWPVLLLVPVVWVLLRALETRRARRVAALVGPRAGELGRGTRRGRTSVFALGLAVALTAFLGPAWGGGHRPTEPRTRDVVFCLDVSRSMLARDAVPDRLQAAREVVVAMTDAGPGARVGLVAFAGSARVVTPLTRDHASFRRLLATTDALSTSHGGTDLAGALATARGLARAARGERAAIVLVTDGDDPGSDAAAAAAACAEAGVTVHVIGVGSAGGGKVPLPGESGETFLRDDSGREVVTALARDALRRVAGAGGGDFVALEGAAARSPAALLETAGRAASGGATVRTGSGVVGAGPTPRFGWALLLALVLWTVAAWLPASKR